MQVENTGFFGEHLQRIDQYNLGFDPFNSERFYILHEHFSF